MAVRISPRPLAPGKWKIERWLADVFPGKERIYEEYRSLPDRELPIVACAVLDVALCELIAARTAATPNETAEFIGADENGIAPAASLGARIQLARILGIITEEDASVLRALKNLRNVMAHRVRIRLTDKRVQSTLSQLLQAWTRVRTLLDNSACASRDAKDAFRQIRELLPTDPAAGQGLVLSALALYQAYFHLMLERGVDSIGNVAFRSVIR